MSEKNTPLPWTYSKSQQYGDTRFYIAQQEGAPYTANYSDVATLIAETVSDEYVAIQEANAALIVRAVNSHEAMRAALELAWAAIGQSRPIMDHYPEPMARHADAQKAVAAALALAKE